MLKKSIKAMLVTAVFCFTAMFSCVNASADDTEILSSLDKLRWGMTLEETEAAMDIPYDSIEKLDSNGQMQTLLTYENVDFKGYDSYVILCITDENNLEGVNFHIPTDNSEAVYSDFYEELKSECAEYEYYDSIALGHFDNDNYSVYLFDFVSEVQYSYFPLCAEEDRGVTQTGGAAVVHEPSPETNNTGASVYACIAALSGIVVVLTRKKRSA